jgi:hypothetical protein
MPPTALNGILMKKVSCWQKLRKKGISAFLRELVRFLSENGQRDISKRRGAIGPEQ